eukprot:COSAG04_NODE_9772_length_834_cov_0.759184_1_plen_131_part_10
MQRESLGAAAPAVAAAVDGAHIVEGESSTACLGMVCVPASPTTAGSSSPSSCTSSGSCSGSGANGGGRTAAASAAGAGAGAAYLAATAAERSLSLGWLFRWRTLCRTCDRPNVLSVCPNITLPPSPSPANS